MEELLYEGLRIAIFPNVYKPAEDSFLLAEMVSEVEGSLLEIGCGTGLVALSFAKHGSAEGVDSFPPAVDNANYNAKLNKSPARFWISDLFERVERSYDWVAFNPPYLPPSSPPTSIDYAVVDRGQISRFLDEVESYAEKGFFLILSSLNPTTPSYLSKASRLGELRLREISIDGERIIGLKVLL